MQFMNFICLFIIYVYIVVFLDQHVNDTCYIIAHEVFLVLVSLAMCLMFMVCLLDL